MSALADLNAVRKRGSSRIRSRRAMAVLDRFLQLGHAGDAMVRTPH